MTRFSSGCLQVLQGQRQKGPNWVLQTLGSGFQNKNWNSVRNLYVNKTLYQTHCNYVPRGIEISETFHVEF